MTTFTKTIIGAVLAVAVATSLYQTHRVALLEAQIQAEQSQAQDKGRDAFLRRLVAHGPPAPHLAASAPAAESPSEERRVANLYARILKGDVPRTTPQQLEGFLKENKRNAGSLLAAYHATGDLAMLREAMEKYPNDPQVDFAAAFNAEGTPEERRHWLDAFKQSAPDNALANYLSALDYFKAGQTDQALQELAFGSHKGQFQDYSASFVQNGIEAYLGAGHSQAEAEMLASTQLPLPQLSQLKEFNQGIVDLAKSYQQNGDDTSAQALLKMDIELGQRFNGGPGESLVSTLVGIAIQRSALLAMDPNSPSPSGVPGQTVGDQINQLTQQRETLKALSNQAEALMENMSDQDFINYKNRWMELGEENALRWVVEKYGNQ